MTDPVEPTRDMPVSLRQQVQQGIAILKRDGVVAYPTDTVYGLGASAFVRSAVERVYAVKRRPRDMPLPLLVADTSQLAGLAADIPEAAWRLIRAFLPGALTLVLRKTASVPDFVAPGATVALRIPAHPVPLALIRGLGAPLVGTSANISGRPSPVTAQEVIEQLGDSIDLVIDGGRTPGGVESSIVDVSGGEVVLLREGSLSRKELQKVCPELR